MARPLDDLLINGEKLSARLSEMVTTARLERTMEGPSTLRVSLFDPDYWLTRESGIIGPRGFRTTASWQERSFTLAQLDKTIDGFDLEFIVTAAAKLSRKNDRYKKSRARMTRARAVGALCSLADVAFANWPGVDARQPIQAFTGDERQTLEDAQTSDEAQAVTRSRIARGALNGKGITIKGAKATRQQLRELETIMSVADQLGVTVKVRQAAVVAAIGESTVTASAVSSMGYAGVFQANPINVPQHDTAQQATYFFKGGKGFQNGGAIALSKQRPELSPGGIADLVEMGGAGALFYDQHLSEAVKIIKAWSPGDSEQSDSELSALTGTPDRARRKTYEFRVNPGESYYEAIVRWAGEVRWRFFIIDTPEHHDGMVWFIDDLTLAAATPSAVIAEGDPGVDRILYSRTRRGRIDQCTVQGQAQFWDYTPGQCIVVNGEGDPADGRWLIRSIEHDLLDDLHMVDITLGKAQPPKAEPKPSIITATGSDPDVPADTPTGRQAQISKAYAKAVAIDKRNYHYSYGGGHANFDGPYDCSGFVSAVLHEAGLGVDTPMDTVLLGQWGKPGRGKFLTVWVKPFSGMNGHTFLVFEDAFTGDGQEFFESGGTSGAVTGRRPDGRSTVGFEPRHWKGL